MLENPKDYIPISSLNDPDEMVFFRGSFPNWLDSNRIGLNLKRTQMMCNLAGIWPMRIYAMNEKEISSDLPMRLARFNPKGKQTPRNVDPKGVYAYYLTGSIPHEVSSPFRSATGDIILNTDEMMRIIQKGTRLRDNVHSVDTWTDSIDNALRMGIESIGEGNLATSFNRYDLLDMERGYISPIFFALALSSVVKIGTETGYVSSFLPSYLFCYAVSLAVTSWRRAKNHGRLSLFHGLQLDRALALVALTRTSKLVKPLKET